MNLWQAAFLGLVQGLTEFLPVSSDGHLVLAGRLVGAVTPGIFVEVALHVATLGAVLVVYGRRLGALALGVLQRRPDDVGYAGLLVVATIPAALAALLLRDVLERTFDSLAVTGVGFILTGLVLWSGRGRGGARSAPGWWQAFIIGAGQALAILPGVSRSGLTVTAALWAGLTPVSAAAFSFLMAVPAIVGAAVFEARGAAADVARVGVLPIVVSCLAALLSGIWAIRFLVALLARGRFYAFAPYCWGLGTLTIAYTLWRA